MRPLNAIDEKTLLTRLRAGDERAFDEIYHRHHRRIYYNIRKVVRIEEITTELHQDIFLKLWEYRQQIDAEKPIEAFLVSISKNLAIDFFRKAARDKLLQEKLMASMTELHDPIATMMDYKDTRQALERAISKLPDQRQKVFRLIKLENQSYEYAAKHFGVSVGTIKDHMAKASRFLQTELSSTHLSILLLLLSSMFSTD